MAVPNGGWSLLMRWHASACIKVPSRQLRHHQQGLIASCLARAVCLWLMKVLSGPWSLFFENPVVCSNRWQVCVWAWSLAVLAHLPHFLRCIWAIRNCNWIRSAFFDNCFNSACASTYLQAKYKILLCGLSWYWRKDSLKNYSNLLDNVFCLTKADMHRCSLKKGRESLQK